ncbi:MAG: DUF2887 domain-containing protein [Microcoleaceae cyanobacterium MO_207.B10]|nr:DUF2887 domain-containing protein [Microcoleaceae cyanobacterium MO_207.B10]
MFYELFLTFPEGFLELIGVDKAETNNYKFTSREVKQLAFRMDGLFLPFVYQLLIKKLNL